MENTNIEVLTATNTPNVPTFKSAALNTYTASIVDAIDSMTNNTSAIASILGHIKSEKCYTDDGFKSVADYAEITFGIKRGLAYRLASLGERFLNNADSMKVLPDVVKDMAPNNLAELTSLTDDQIKAAVDAGKLTATSTQKEIREVAAAAKADTSPAKVHKGPDFKLFMDAKPTGITTKEPLLRKAVEDYISNVWLNADGTVADHAIVKCADADMDIRFIVVNKQTAAAALFIGKYVKPENAAAKKSSKTASHPGDIVKQAIADFTAKNGREPSTAELLELLK